MYDSMFDANTDFAGEIVDLTEFKDAKKKKQQGWKPKLV